MSILIKFNKSLQVAPIVIALLFSLVCGDLAAQNKQLSTVHANEANGDYEPNLLVIIESLQAGKLSHALTLLDTHLIDFPKSQVGHFLKADVLTAMTDGIQQLGSSSLASKDELRNLKHQIINRWQHPHQYDSEEHQKIPSNLLEIGEHPYVVVADMGKGRLYLYSNDNGKPVLMRDYYMSVGSAGYGKNVEGDNKTPIGLYHINRYIEGRALPDLYGKGAFPVNYPNRYDQFLKRTGYGIWLHGTPSDTYARSPWSSEGCFVLSNDDLLDIGQFVSAEKRTPVILSETIEWLSLDELEKRKLSLIKVINAWKQDWESLDTENYIRHYQRQNFNFNSDSFKTWSQRKKTVNEAKTFIQVNLELQSLFSYPGEKDMFVVKFKQRYLSDNYSGESIKEQYWKRDESGRWRIIYEG